ncbi:hypothetical protein RMCBS344292_03405 [Rhizopus microsporus]|nr:hypothetical protein RMCBS344292_03405 [Rhizopus microsporus]
MLAQVYRHDYREIQKLVTFTSREIVIIESEDFQGMINSRHGKFKGTAQRVFDDLEEMGYQTIFGQMVFASSCAGLYIPGYYGDDGAEAIFNVGVRKLDMKKLVKTPWAENASTMANHVNLLRYTMVPSIALHLIQEDISAISEGDDCSFDYVILERILTITAHSNYKFIHVELDDDE